MAEYCLNYSALKTSIKKQSITIKDALNIQILNNLGPIFKIYLTIVIDKMQKDEKLEEDKVLFKVIEEEETCIKAKHKASANFALIISNTIPKRGASKIKKEFIEWLKYKKCGYKYLADQACKYTNKKCNKCHKKGHISCLYDSYTFLNKKKTLEELATSSSDFKKNVNYVTLVIANKMFETGISQKIIVDSSTMQHFIANQNLISNYYNNY